MRPTVIGMVCTLALCGAARAGAQTPAEGARVAKDGPIRQVGQAFPRPAESSSPWTASVTEAGSAFLRLHFVGIQDQTTADYTVVVRDYRGAETKIPKREFARGPEYWTLIVNGDVAHVKVLNAPASGLRFTLKEVAYQRPANAQILSIINGNDLKPVRFYASDANLMRSARTVGKLSFVVDDSFASCSGFMVADNLYLTNNHCVSTAAVCSTAVVAFGYEEDENGIALVKEQAKCVAVVSTDAPLDYALLRLEGTPGSAAKWGHVTLSDRIVTSEETYIVEHPSGEPKQFSKIDCRISTPSAPGTAGSAKVDFGHECDTMPGSSGSPVFDHEHRVVGLHHLGLSAAPWNKQNRAVQMHEILPRIRDFVTSPETAGAGASH